VSVDRVKKIIDLNKRGVKVEKLVEDQEIQKTEIEYIQETTEVDRFDQQNNRRKKHQQRGGKYSS
jgi:hypothetical protein